MEKIKFQIIDNFLDESEYDDVFDLVTNGIQWKTENFNENELYLTQTLYEKHSPINDYYDRMIPMMDKIRIIGLIEMQFNLYLKNNYIATTKKEKKYNFNHGVAIYYLNTNNGYTLLNNGTTIESKKNRLLIFESDNNKPYYESNCTDSKYKSNIVFSYF